MRQCSFSVAQTPFYGWRGCFLCVTLAGSSRRFTCGFACSRAHLQQPSVRKDVRRVVPFNPFVRHEWSTGEETLHRRRGGRSGGGREPSGDLGAPPRPCRRPAGHFLASGCVRRALVQSGALHPQVRLQRSLNGDARTRVSAFKPPSWWRRRLMNA